jgi:ABC-type multidrug transport system fused ATPase/permease subunit
VAFATAPFLAWLVVRRAPRVKRTARVARRQAASWLALAEETLGALPMVHAFRAHDRETARFQARADVARRAEIRSVIVQAQLTLFVEMIAVVGGLVVLVVAAHHVSTGGMTLGAVVAFLGSLGSLYEPARELGQIASRFQRAAAGAHRVADLLDTRGTVVERAGAVRLIRSAGRIEFRDVQFTYPRGGDVLNGVSFTVEPGEIVAIVGASGSGKSTLVRLLLRFHDTSAGAVLIDGEDVRDITLASLRANIAVAFQDPYVVHGSIVDNVRYGRPDASDADVARAIKAARAETFAHGYRRQSAASVGPRGERLSGGQRQRLALARVFLRNAPILVLDEATAAVDGETEELIHASIQRFARRRTILVIGHRLATVRQADRVVVLEHGRIAEIGTPAALLRHGNRCYDLFAGQLARGGRG